MMRRYYVALALILSTLSGLALGARFAAGSRQVSVTRVEDSPGLEVLARPLECRSFFPDFSIGNEEPVPFELIPDEFFVDVRFTRRPDTELGDGFYAILVVCEDDGPPDTATVSVTITSVNEYSPYAPQDSYSITFSEAAREGEVVGSAGSGPNQYLIVDEDGGLDGRLSYTALDEPPNPYFALDPDTGDLILQSGLDYERMGSLASSILIHGCDRATPSVLCPNVTVTLTLTAANDNDPKFLQPDYSVAVEEGLHRGTDLMANITCWDEDIGEGSYAGIEIVSSTLVLVGLSDMQTGMATLLLTAVLDYDFSNDTEFEVELRCYDSASDGEVRTGDATVHIHVVPVNDHSPHFTADWYNTSVLESLPIGSSLLRAQCSDEDRDYGTLAAMQLYQPSPAVNSTFHLDQATGQLTLIGSLDYDKPITRSYIFTIRCSDEGGREVFSRIFITTLPVSDEPLTFQTPVFEFTVDRLTDIHSRIGQVTAIDGDQGEVPIIAYLIENNDLFDVDDEGYIVLIDYLSRDKGDFFNLTVEARDSQGAIKTQVEVSVTGSLSLLGVINVGIGAFGLTVVVIIGILVALCSYFCWKLYRSPREDNMSEVPVFMRGDNLPHTRPISTHSQNSSSKCRHLHHSRGKSTLSMHRARKKPKHGFRATQQPGIRNCFFVNSDTSPRADLEDNQVLFAEEMEMTIFRNEDTANGTEGWREAKEVTGSAHNIFNPEDAGLMLGDIMPFPGHGEEQTRWDSDKNDKGSWPLLDKEDGEEGKGEEEHERSGTETDFGGSAEWDVSGTVEWDPDEQDTNSLTLTHI